MRALAITGFNGMESVHIVDMGIPALNEGEVRIRVHAAGLNPADWKLAEGWLSPVFTPIFPYALGFDAAGVVEAVGAGVSGIVSGDRVVAKTAVGRGGAGGCAELVTVPGHLVSPLPDGLGFIEAAALPTAGITAWEALFCAGALAPGQSVLVNGGAGGTGSFAVSLGVMAGARVAATARVGNHGYLADLGAALPLDYRWANWKRALWTMFPDGVDVVLDTVGQGVLTDPLDLVRDGGAFVTIGTLVPDEPRPTAAEAARRGIRMVTAMSNREREADQLHALVARLAEGDLRLPAIETLPVREAANALARLREGHVRGKLVVDLEQGWA
ncbi:hypothetical protein MB02_07350 [Croceicoccus estronivorus]|uniref:NADP-dependent oxidoreductase n=1 Tax=Croceicoccus estronivorus TaxID=1172626 RepID=UPI0008344061|nr:NADP-dependent oxidoreductase [Croceicoccus estronivorus]OCC24389.1 hypothetical protein MB02_07350 [Croceicoccus estronivorus]